MKAAVALVVVLMAACSGSASTGANSTAPTPSKPVQATASTTPTPLRYPPFPVASDGPLSSSYGLLIGSGKLEMINSRGAVAASAPINPPSVGKCANGTPVALEPPVSATTDHVYFRDGDTQIRSLTLDGQTRDVTTVQGGPTTVSFFSVSPDDSRIAVEVDAVSGGEVSERLYTEDLSGGAHHVDLYSTTASDRTLWPMGWYQGQLLLAVMPTCADNASELSPLEWHVSSSSTGNRIATITNVCFPGSSQVGVLSRWPSPAGVACGITNYAGPATYNWSGAQTAVYISMATGLDFTHAELSPSGAELLVANTNPPRGERVQVSPFAGGFAFVNGHEPCLWIDETHMLAPDAVIATGSGTSQVAGLVSTIAAPGICAGVYPNTL